MMVVRADQILALQRAAQHRSFAELRRQLEDEHPGEGAAVPLPVPLCEPSCGLPPCRLRQGRRVDRGRPLALPMGSFETQFYR